MMRLGSVCRGAVATWLPCLLLGTGCLGGPQHGPMQPTRSDLVADDLPQYSKNRVHVFMMQGLNPLDSADLDGMREYLISQGFIKTSLGPAFYAPWYLAEIRRIHKEDPDARFVLVGQGYGLDAARVVARAMRKDQATVDILVAVDGSQQTGSPEPSADNVAQVMSIHNRGWWNAGEVAPGRQNMKTDNERIAAVNNSPGLESIALALVGTAGQVPIHAATLESAFTGPTPRAKKKVAANPAEEKEWSFIRPDQLTTLGPTRSNSILSGTGHTISPPTSKEAAPETPKPAKPEKPAEAKPLRVTAAEIK